MNYVKNNYIFWTIVLILLVTVLLQMVLSTLSDSPTNDEQVHLLAGLSYLSFHDLRVNPEHPPLSKLLSAIGVKVLYTNLKFPYTKEQFNDQTQWLQPIADTMFAQNDPTKLLLFSRFPLMLLTIFYALILFIFLDKKSGRIPALLTLTLFTFEPNILGFGKIVITDNAVAGFTFLAGIFLYQILTKKKFSYWVGFSISLLLSLLSKYTAIFFIPIFWISALLYFLSKRSLLKNLLQFTLRYFVVLIFCFIGIWGFYGIFSRPSLFLHDKPPYASFYAQVKPQWLITALRKSPLPYYYSYGISYVVTQGFFGQKVYLLGKWGNHNWWWFYPVTFFLKTPLIYLFLFALSTAVGLRRNNKTTRVFISIFCMYLITVSFSPLAIGMRVILPLTYLMLTIIGVNLSHLFKIKNWTRFIVATIALSGFLRIASYPNYISHINAFKYFFNPYDMMADTNCDWGQDIKRMAEYFKTKGITKVYFAHDAAVKPVLYGLETMRLPYNFESPKPKGWIALSISARNFPIKVKNGEGNEGGYEHPYSWLEQYPLIHTIGDTILIYFIQ